jgi:hypothetical protein
MNIWTRLGISVALAALFYIGVSELLQDKLVYEVHKWRFCVGALIFGVSLFFVGSWLNRKTRGRYHAAQEALPEQERDNDPAQGEPFMLFNLAYWGVMLAIFSVIIVVIVPTPRQKEHAKAEVAARTTTTNRPAQAPPPTTPTPTNPPAFKFQGMVIRDSTRSALINGRTYFIGDSVGEAKVIAIETNKTVLQWRGIDVVLPAPQ